MTDNKIYYTTDSRGDITTIVCYSCGVTYEVSAYAYYIGSSFACPNCTTTTVITPQPFRTKQKMKVENIRPKKKETGLPYQLGDLLEATEEFPPDTEVVISVAGEFGHFKICGVNLLEKEKSKFVLVIQVETFKKF